MPRTFNKVALVEIVGAHAVMHEIVDEGSNNTRAVVDAREQDGLVAEREAAVGQYAQGLAG